MKCVKSDTAPCLCAGNPPPRVLWYYNGQLLDDQMDPVIILDQHQHGTPVPTLHRYKPNNKEEGRTTPGVVVGGVAEDGGGAAMGGVNGGDSAVDDNSIGAHLHDNEGSALQVRNSVTGRRMFLSKDDNQHDTGSDLIKKRPPMYRINKSLVKGNRRRKRSTNHVSDVTAYDCLDVIQLYPEHPLARHCLVVLSRCRENPHCNNITRKNVHISDEGNREMNNTFGRNKYFRARYRRRGLSNFLTRNLTVVNEYNNGVKYTTSRMKRSSIGFANKRSSTDGVPVWNSTYRNTVRLGPFSRADLKSELRCEASNSNLTNPVVASFVIDMNREYPRHTFTHPTVKAKLRVHKYTLNTL